jgi:hypothetical protein
MKRVITTGALSLALLLGACSDPDTETMKKADKSEPTEVKTKEPKAEETKDDGKDNGWETQVGETVENEGGEFTLLGRNDKVEPMQTGPIKLEIPQVNKTTGKLKGSMKEMFESDVANYIQVDVKVENTTDETISFYPDQATITTNTGEQVNSELMMSDDVGGDFIGKIKKEGSVFFFLEKSKAEDIEWVRLLIDAPHNENLESLGEPIDIKVEF